VQFLFLLKKNLFYGTDFEKRPKLIFNNFRSKNYQSHDLGLDPLLEGETEIEKAILQLDSQIDLMMITEYMDKSLILLKAS